MYGMDVYKTLRREARAKRDNAINAARERYGDTIVQIDTLQAMMGHRVVKGAPLSDRQVRHADDDAPFSALTLLEAAERVLLEGRPLRMTELTIELQRRGCRAGDNPRKLAIAIRSAFYYHKGRFVRGRDGRWGVA